MMVTRYRIVGQLSSSPVTHVAFEGSLEDLKREFPVAKFPNPIQRWVEDILGGRGGTRRFKVEVATTEPTKRELVWNLVCNDPRF
jgi:hypothetical protein